MAWREGNKAFDEKCLPAILRDYESIMANEAWCSDGHTVNLFVINDLLPEKYGEIVRPQVVMWKDIRSRKIMGYEVDISEKTETVWKAFAKSIKNNNYYLPQHILVDNGSAYKNKQSLGTEDWEGLYSRLGVDEHFAIPYNAKSKPIEAFWRWFDSYVSRMLPGYTGRNNQAMPEETKKLVKTKKLLKMSEFVALLEEKIDDFNNMTGHQGHGMEGRSPNQVFKQTKIQTKRLSEKEFATLFLERKTAKVYRDGIRFMGWYYQDKIGEWAKYQNRKVQISFNPDDFSCLYVFDNAGRELFKAFRVERAKWMFDSDVNNMAEYRRLYGNKKRVRKIKNELANEIGENYRKTIETSAVLIEEKKEIDNENFILPWEKN